MLAERRVTLGIDTTGVQMLALVAALVATGQYEIVEQSREPAPAIDPTKYVIETPRRIETVPYYRRFERKRRPR